MVIGAMANAEERKRLLQEIVLNLTTIHPKKFGATLIYPGECGRVDGSTPRNRENSWRQKFRDPSELSSRSTTEVDLTVGILYEFLELLGYDLSTVAFTEAGFAIEKQTDNNSRLFGSVKKQG